MKIKLSILTLSLILLGAGCFGDSVQDTELTNDNTATNVPAVNNNNNKIGRAHV